MSDDQVTVRLVSLLLNVSERSERKGKEKTRNRSPESMRDLKEGCRLNRDVRTR